MTPSLFIEMSLVPALALLPERMNSREAWAMVVAVCLQESQFKHRRQMAGGPGRSWAQFEHGTEVTRGGVTGVLMHPESRPHIRHVLDVLGYDYSADTSYAAIEHNDVLCAAYARLLLWTLPQALPKMGEAQRGWDQYYSAWRPGIPRRESWDGYFEQAWAVV